MITTHLAEETMHTADRELEACARGAGLALARGLASLAGLAFTRHVGSEIVGTFFR